MSKIDSALFLESEGFDTVGMLVTGDLIFVIYEDNASRWGKQLLAVTRLGLGWISHESVTPVDSKKR